MYVDYFYDDFTLPGLDSYKWNLTTGAITSLSLNTISGSLTFAPSSTVSLSSVPPLSNTSTSAVFVGVVDFTGAGYFEFSYNNTTAPELARFQLSGATLTMTYITSGNVTTSTTVTYNPYEMQYWRIRNSATTIYWETSADGRLWTVRRSLAGTLFANGKVWLKTSNAGVKIAKFNTVDNVPRSGGWLTDDFDAYAGTDPIPLTTATSNFWSKSGTYWQTGQWFSEPVTGQPTPIYPSPSIVTPTVDMGLGPTTKVLRLTERVVAYAAPPKIRSLSDVDIRASIWIDAFSSYTGSPGAIISWRGVDASGNPGKTYYNSIRIFRDRIEFWTYHAPGGSSLVVATAYMDTITKFWYKFRITQSDDNTAIVYRDGVEILRATYPATPTAAGNKAAGMIWFGPTDINGWMYVNDVEINELSYEPEAEEPTPGAPQTPPPENYVSATFKTQFEYVRLEDASGRTLILSPSYGSIWIKDIDFGTPSARAVINPRTQTDGTRNYTRFHGDKTVIVNLFVLTDAYGSVAQYKDALAYWAAPGKKCRMVFKPAREDERYMDLVGSQFNSPITTESRQHAEVTIQWICPDGGSYSSKLNRLTLLRNSTTNVINNGSDRSEPVIRIIGGPAAGDVAGAVRNKTLEARYFGRLSYIGISSVAIDSFVEFNYKLRTVMANGVYSQANNSVSKMTGRFWFPLDPGINMIYMEKLDGEIQWRDKFTI